MTAACALALVLAQAPPTPTSRLFDAATLLEDLRALSADDMAGRAMGTDGAARARAYLARRFQAVGLTPLGRGGDFLHEFEAPAARNGRRLAGVNLVGLVRGTRTPDRYLVVSAHYDHLGLRNGQVYNGANDNASGAAALAAIASHFLAHPPSASLLVVAFDGEEAGLLGARAFIRAPPVPLAAIAANINADMIGRDAAETLFVSGTARFPVLAPLVATVASTAPVRVVAGHDGLVAGEDDWTNDSDQFAFMEAGIPAVYVGVDDRRYHHRPDDDFDTMMPAFYVGSVEVVIALVRQFDTHATAILAARR